MSRPSLNILSAFPSSSCIEASTEGELPVGHPGPTTGNSWTVIQENTPGLPQVNGIHKIVKIFTRSDVRKVAKKSIRYWPKLSRLKVITGYTFNFHSSGPVDKEVKIIGFFF